MLKTLSLSQEAPLEDDGSENLLHKSGSNNFSKLPLDYELGEVNIWQPSSYTQPPPMQPSGIFEAV